MKKESFGNGRHHSLVVRVRVRVLLLACSCRRNQHRLMVDVMD
jgi:hypothetical protein